MKRSKLEKDFLERKMRERDSGEADTCRVERTVSNDEAELAK